MLNDYTKNVMLEIVSEQKVMASSLDNRDDLKWRGIPSGRMKRYAFGQWINSKDNYPVSEGYSSAGKCGTITASAMLAYYDDYINDNYVPTNLRVRGTSDPGNLIKTVFNYIDKGHNGTIASTVSDGINSYLNNYYVLDQSRRSYYDYTSPSVLQFTKAQLDNEVPIVIGLLGGGEVPPEYRKHWVLVYQYTTNGEYFRCVDNHQSYRASIRRNWALGSVRLKETANYVTVSRLYNKGTGEHLYTADVNEVEWQSHHMWTYEGDAWRSSKTGVSVYRLLNPNSGEHFYTKDSNEKNVLIKVGWKYEGIAWYVPEKGTVPVYRLYNPNAQKFQHHFTADLKERNYLISIGWKDEGIAWNSL